MTTRNAFQGPHPENFPAHVELGWSHFWHVNGFLAQVTFALSGVGDGDPAENWADEIGGKTLTQATSANRPLYRATGGINGRACLEGRNTTNGNVAVTFDAEIPQPWSVVHLGQFAADPVNDANLTDGVTNAALCRYESASGDGDWEIRSGATLTGPDVQGITSPQLVVYHANGANSYVEVNNSDRVTGDAGTNGIDGMTAFTNRTGAGESAYRFTLLAVYPGDVTTDDNWRRFLEWIEAYYELDMNL